MFLYDQIQKNRKNKQQQKKKNLQRYGAFQTC